ncbi:hypothetical protein ADL22_25875 [Streptomyces sp. NRRL F-4489]|uniref:DUF4232 domain-containing protein n=1 Tax=Streptomyces sp. NRRL F-4489 TaxID=1609095 RepID=UPI000749CCAF|nr:DUF4232 domain-containing protein [Streptomyces sp. NRRL F-4489]KUL35998.1 hypothetical protein ADL22_25875 [Streptomyces sp. NRRL F-4489]
MPRTDAATARTSSRAVRRRTLRIAAAGLTAVAALTLTACGGQSDPLKTSDAKPFNPAPQDANDPAANALRDGKGGASSADQGSGGTAGKSGGTGSAPVADGAPVAGKQGGAAPAATGRGKGTGARQTACDVTKIRITAKPLTRPINHLMLVATNTSGVRCDLYAAPALRFDEAQSPVAELPDSKPQAVVSLEPGESGYAGVLLSGADGAENGRTVTSLTVYLARRDGQGSTDGSAKVALPGGSAYLDDSARVTYWQTDPNTAASW